MLTDVDMSSLDSVSHEQFGPQCNRSSVTNNNLPEASDSISTNGVNDVHEKMSNGHYSPVLPVVVDCPSCKVTLTPPAEDKILRPQFLATGSNDMVKPPSPANCLTPIEEMDHAMLQDELVRARMVLKLKETECSQLLSAQDQTGREIEDLTASLFEEANKMVQDANVKRMAAEKLLKESNTKIEILQAEVTALKALVITSTPSMPNPHLNPQIDKAKKAEFSKGHRRSTSHHSFVKDEVKVPMNVVQPEPNKRNPAEADPVNMEVFRCWRKQPVLDLACPFLERIVQDDVEPCLRFANKQLSMQVHDGILNNTLAVEPSVQYKMFACQRCSLTETTSMCSYCIKLGDQTTPYAISQVARNRIIAVCDFITYIRYITQGLVKSDDREVYWEIMKLRKKMCLARLGLDD